MKDKIDSFFRRTFHSFFRRTLYRKANENSVSIIFQFHVVKFNQKQCFSFSFGYTGLYAGYSVKEAVNNFSC